MRNGARPFLLLVTIAATASAKPVAAQTEHHPPEPPAATGNDDAPPEKATKPTGADANVDDIFRQVFGKDRPALGRDTYVVLVDGINVGSFMVTPPNDEQSGDVEASFVDSVLSTITSPEISAELKKISQDRKTVGFQEIENAGIEIKFNHVELALIVTIPNAIRSVRPLNLRTFRTRSNLDFVPQARFSGYISGRLGITYVENSQVTPTGIDRIAADMDVGINILGVVAQARLRYDDSQRRKFSRDDIRLTYDDRSTLVRYEAGDLSIGNRPFQGTPNIAGISASRNFNINPYRIIRPISEQAFELDRAARVEVLLNGTPVKTYDLPGGRYSLRDLPLVPSAGNDIELRITYATGEVETRIFPAFYDLELLAPGLTDFSLNVGVPFRDENGIRRYNRHDYNVIGFIRHGFSPELTAGLTFEGNRSLTRMGGEVLWASPLGTIGINASIDVQSARLNTGQLTIQYRWTDRDQDTERMFDAFVGLTGKDYRNLGQLFETAVIAKQARARYGQKLFRNTRIQVYGGYEEYYIDQDKSYYGGVTVSQQLGVASLSFGAEYSRRENRNGPIFRVNLSVPLGRASLTSSYTTEDNAARIDYNRSALVGAYSLGFAAGAERRDGADRQYVRANYIGNRIEASIQQTARNYFSRERNDTRTEFSFGTALVMADGTFALSRPVIDSFAIVRPDKRVSEYKLAVEPRSGFGSSKRRYTAFSDSLGPAVVPSLTSYFNRALRVESPDAPAGTSLDGQVFSINPGYKSGYNLKVGGGGNVSVVGNLVDRDGDPMPFIVANVRVRSGDKGDQDKTSQIFTNSSGRFVLEQVEAGKSYEITFETGGRAFQRVIAVPDNAIGIHNLPENISFDLDINPDDTGAPAAEPEAE